MAVYTFGQLETLWIDAGGSKALAPLMAAIAMAESTGNDQAQNPSGASGLWQILGAVNPADQGSLFDPKVNAHEAVLKYQTQGLTAWETYTNGAYKQFLPAGFVPPAALSGGPPGGSQPQDQAQPGGGSLDVTAPLRAAGAFLHDISVPVAWALEVFEPGQGVRLVAGAGAIAAGAGGVKAWHAAAQNPEGTALPVAIALFGVAAAGAFIAIRPWPQPGGKPVRTLPYIASVVKGQPPAAGPAARPPVGAVEAGLVTLFGLWAASKAAEGIAGAVTAGAGIGAAFSKLWSKIKPIAADVGKAGEVAGEAAA